MNKQYMVLTLLVVAVMLSALAVVYVKHQNRVVYADLQHLQKLRDEMNVAWGQLQLEQSTFATHSRVEQIAREKMGMTLPGAKEIVIVKP
ncbi:MAG: cell division protein FtsL [Gammaproteobacteria bacterium]|nr:cell division protein FtsL [Gammaproteobacteria bacterium]